MKTFSAMWSAKLGQAIAAAAPPVYQMSLTYDDAQSVMLAVNEGIDSHLQACYVPARGDDFQVVGSKLECWISRESLPVLVRRLMEQDDAGHDLASSICYSIGIELI